MKKQHNTPPDGKLTVYIDVMLNGSFVCQLPYEYRPFISIKEKDVKRFIVNKRPTLKGKDIKIAFTNNKV